MFFKTAAMRLLTLAVHCTANMDDLSTDIRRQIARKEQSHLGHLLRSTSTTERNLLCPFFTNLLRQRIGHIGDNEACSYAVCTNSTWSHFLRNRRGETDKAGLRGGIIALSCIAR